MSDSEDGELEAANGAQPHETKRERRRRHQQEKQVCRKHCSHRDAIAASPVRGWQRRKDAIAHGLMQLSPSPSDGMTAFATCVQAAKKKAKQKDKHRHRERHKHEHHRGDRKRSRADSHDDTQHHQAPKRAALSLAEACAPQSRAAAVFGHDSGPPGLDIDNAHATAASGSAALGAGRHAPKELFRTGQHIRF